MKTRRSAYSPHPLARSVRLVDDVRASSPEDPLFKMPIGIRKSVKRATEGASLSGPSLAGAKNRAIATGQAMQLYAPCGLRCMLQRFGVGTNALHAVTCGDDRMRLVFFESAVQT